MLLSVLLRQTTNSRPSKHSHMIAACVASVAVKSVIHEPVYKGKSNTCYVRNNHYYVSAYLFYFVGQNCLLHMRCQFYGVCPMPAGNTWTRNYTWNVILAVYNVEVTLPRNFTRDLDDVTSAAFRQIDSQFCSAVSSIAYSPDK